MTEGNPYLDSLLDDEASGARALEIGREWFGDDHPAVACLKLDRTRRLFMSLAVVLKIAWRGGAAVDVTVVASSDDRQRCFSSIGKADT